MLGRNETSNGGGRGKLIVTYLQDLNVLEEEKFLRIDLGKFPGVKHTVLRRDWHLSSKERGGPNGNSPILGNSNAGSTYRSTWGW